VAWCRVPDTYCRRVLGGILLKAAGMDALLTDTLVLIAFAVLLLGFSVRRFQENIE